MTEKTTSAVLCECQTEANKRMRRGIIKLLVAFLLALPSVTANAGLYACNNTTETLETTIGFIDPASKVWSSVGWYTLASGKCEEVVTGPLAHDSRGRFALFLYTQNNGAVWTRSNATFCIGRGGKIEGRENCEARGYETKWFEGICPDQDTFIVHYMPSGWVRTSRDSASNYVGINRPLGDIRQDCQLPKGAAFK